MRFFSITKPGIIFGNGVTAAGGFFLGFHPPFSFLSFFAMLVGLSLVIACGCVFNNLIDQDIDGLMRRTQNRVLVKGLIARPTAFVYGLILGLLGFILLYLMSGILATAFAFLGWFFYVVVYSLSLKRNSNYGTLIGAIAGAVPPVVGYCAATQRFDLGAVLFFVILFLWQMPHFYAIAMYRLKDFKAASIPVLPLQKSLAYTRRSIMAYIFVFTLASASPTYFGYAGPMYGVVALALGILWFVMGIAGFREQADGPWARKMFLFSIVNITVLCFAVLLKGF
jgi:protoheme IX farnesyltransferase